MNAIEMPMDDPVGLVLQALDVCNLIRECGTFKNEQMLSSARVLQRLVFGASETLALRAQIIDPSEQCDAFEASSLDLLEAIGVASLMIEVLESENFQPDGPDNHGIDAVRTLLLLCKSSVDAAANRLMSQQSAPLLPGEQTPAPARTHAKPRQRQEATA